MTQSWNDRASGDSLSVSPLIPDNPRPLLADNEIDNQMNGGVSLPKYALGHDHNAISSMTSARI